MRKSDLSDSGPERKKSGTAVAGVLRGRELGARRMKARARTLAVCVVILVPACSSMLFSQKLKYSKPPDAKNGKILYESGCIACHGRRGEGAPQTSVEFKQPDSFPDFTRCDQTTAETNA